MDKIEEIWNKGNDQIEKDTSFGSEAILKSISKNSIGISSKILKSVRFCIVLAFLTLGALLYNIFPYRENSVIEILITLCLTVSASVITFLFLQIGVIKKLDEHGMSLREVLIKKIKYLSTKYTYVLHSISLIIVLATFTINLTMEGNDGVFETHKILLLSVFYVVAYVVTYSLVKVAHIAYNKQLRSALMNLNEKSKYDLDELIARHKKNGRVLLLIIAFFLLSGIAALLLIL